MIQADDLKSEEPKSEGTAPKLDHQCDWRVAAVKLARCVVATLQSDGKIGVGSGLVMRTRDGKRVVERWDREFVEALAFVGIEVVEKPKSSKKPKTSARASARRAGAVAR